MHLHLFQLREKILFPGLFFENFVANELIAKEHKLFYWRGKSSAELEFIIESDNKLYPIDVKRVEELLIHLINFLIIISLNLLSKYPKIIMVIILSKNY